MKRRNLLKLAAAPLLAPLAALMPKSPLPPGYVYTGWVYTWHADVQVEVMRLAALHLRAVRIAPVPAGEPWVAGKNFLWMTKEQEEWARAEGQRRAGPGAISTARYYEVLAQVCREAVGA